MRGYHPMTTSPYLKGPRIVTSNIYPPIPDRRFDWCAYRDGWEELGHYGYGRTEAEAISDLIGNVEAE